MYNKSMTLHKRCSTNCNSNEVSLGLKIKSITHCMDGRMKHCICRLDNGWLLAFIRLISIGSITSTKIEKATIYDLWCHLHCYLTVPNLLSLSLQHWTTWCVAILQGFSENFTTKCGLGYAIVIYNRIGNSAFLFPYTASYPFEHH